MTSSGVDGNDSRLSYGMWSSPVLLIAVSYGISRRVIGLRIREEWGDYFVFLSFI